MLTLILYLVTCVCLLYDYYHDIASLLLTAARVPAMVNFSSGAAPSRSPRKRQPSSSPKRPVSDPNSQSSERRSPVKVVQKVVLEEEAGNSGENPVNHGNRSQKWFEGGGDLAESALKAVREGNVISANERSYPNPTDDNRKKRTSKTKEPVSDISKKKNSPRSTKICHFLICCYSPIQSIEERVKKHLQIVSEAEQKLAALQKEKEKVRSIFLSWYMVIN